MMELQKELGPQLRAKGLVRAKSFAYTIIQVIACVPRLDLMCRAEGAVRADLAQVLVTLEQEHVLSAVAAMDGQLPGPLLAGDDGQLRRKGGDRHHRLPDHVGPRHRQLQTLYTHMLRLQPRETSLRGRAPPSRLRCASAISNLLDPDMA